MPKPLDDTIAAEQVTVFRWLLVAVKARSLLHHTKGWRLRLLGSLLQTSRTHAAGSGVHHPPNPFEYPKQMTPKKRMYPQYPLP
jgi:hypothetical protein